MKIYILKYEESVSRRHPVALVIANNADDARAEFLNETGSQSIYLLLVRDTGFTDIKEAMDAHPGLDVYDATVDQSGLPVDFQHYANGVYVAPSEPTRIWFNTSEVLEAAGEPATDEMCAAASATIIETYSNQGITATELSN